MCLVIETISFYRHNEKGIASHEYHFLTAPQSSVYQGDLPLLTSLPSLNPLEDPEAKKAAEEAKRKAAEAERKAKGIRID